MPSFRFSPLISRFFCLLAGLVSNVAAADMAPTWSFYPGMFVPGRQGIEILDLNGDGQDEVVYTAKSRPINEPGRQLLVVLERRDGAWVVAHVKEFPAGVNLSYNSRIRRIPGEPADRLFAQVYDSNINNSHTDLMTFAGITLETASAVFIQNSFEEHGIADVDGDGNLELYGVFEVLPSVRRPALVDLNTAETEWSDATLSAQFVGAGQLDGDSPLELVFGTITGIATTGPGLVLDGATRAVQWTWPAGLNGTPLVGNFQGTTSAMEFALVDGVSASLYSTASGLAFIRGFPVSDVGISEVEIVDVNGDQVDDIVVGDGPSPVVRGYAAQNGALMFTLSRPGLDVLGLAVGNLDPQPGIEVAFNAGAPGPAPESLFVANATNGQNLFSQKESLGPMSSVLRADLNGDGSEEVVVVTQGFGGNHLFVLDTRTGIRLRQAESIFSTPQTIQGDVVRLQAANMDADPQLEIVAGTSAGGGASAYVVVLDSTTLALQWSNWASLGSLRGMTLFQANGDSIPDIALMGDDHLSVQNGQNGTQLWSSPNFVSTGPATLVVGNLDGDANAEIAVAAESSVRVIDTVTHSIDRTLSSPAPLIGQWIETVGGVCQHVLVSATSLSRRSCLTGLESTSRVLPGGSIFVRPLDDSFGLLAISDGSKAFVLEGNAIVAQTTLKGLSLGWLNFGSQKLAGGKAELILGHEYGVFRFDLSPFLLMANGFE